MVYNTTHVYIIVHLYLYIILKTCEVPGAHHRVFKLFSIISLSSGLYDMIIVFYIQFSQKPHPKLDIQRLKIIYTKLKLKVMVTRKTKQCFYVGNIHSIILLKNVCFAERNFKKITILSNAISNTRILKNWFRI